MASKQMCRQLLHYRLRSCRSTASKFPPKTFFSTEAHASTDQFGYKGQSELYRLYRPKYPLSMLQILNERIPVQKSKRRLAIDIACGPGTLTPTLAAPLNFENATNAEDFGFGFESVIGIDKSRDQLNQAMDHAMRPNIEYRFEEFTDRLSMHNESVDLVTVAQGLHWFDIPKLLTEIRRILKGDGLCAVLGYGAPRFDQYEQFQEEFGKYYVRTLGSYNYGSTDPNKHCYWKIDRKLLDFAFEDESMFVGEDKFQKETFERTFVFDNKFMTEQQLFGYLQSMSGYQSYMAAHGLQHWEDGDPMIHLREVYREDMKRYNQTKMMVIFPFHLLTMKK